VLGDTPTRVYFSHFTNKNFHDLTTKKSIPASAAVDQAIKLFDRDFYIKVFFADSDDDSDDEEPIENTNQQHVDA